MAFSWLTRLFRRSAPPAALAVVPPVWARPLRIAGLDEQRHDGSTNYLSELRTDSFFDGLIGGGHNGFAGGGWNNPVTGHGTGRDKVMYGSFRESVRLTDSEISALYNGNDLAKRIISAKPKEMFRRGWVLAFPGTKKRGDPAGRTDEPGPQDNPPPKGTVESMGDTGGTGALMAKAKARTDAAPPSDPSGAPRAADDESGPAAPSPQAIPGIPTTTVKPGNPAPGGQNDNADMAAQVEEYAKAIGVMPKCQESTIFGRAYGGGLLIIGADDGQAMNMPLNEDNIKSVRYLTWIDRRYVVAHAYYETIGPQYGEVEVWNVINPFGNQSNQYVHESRVVRFDGAPVDLIMRRRLAGWTLSVLQDCYDVMRQFDMSFQSVANLMADISQAVMKIEGLAQLISNDQRTLQTRMTMVDQSRSSARMVYLDAEHETFERVATPLTGVSDTLEMQMLRMAAAAEMPVAILFGREPSGLNATGDADFRRFYDTIAGEQKQVLEPKLNRIYTLICKAKDAPTKGKIPEGGLAFTWHKLYEPSEKEQSEIRWNMAQADEKYVVNQILLPEEVAMSRFRSGDLHLDTEIQGDLRREKLKTAQLPPSGAEKAQVDQQNKESEMKLKSDAIAAKPAPTSATKP